MCRGVVLVSMATKNAATGISIWNEWNVMEEGGAKEGEWPGL